MDAMTSHSARVTAAPSHSGDLRRGARTLALAAGVALSISVGMVAIGSGLGVIELPFQMHLVDERLPVIFRLHMVASALALLMLPAVIAARRQPHVHRTLGRLLGVFVFAGGISALPVAIFSNSSELARAGFFVQGLVWMALFFSAVRAIRTRRIELHARLMLAMAAVTTGAVWFRAVTGSAILLGLPFEATYTAAAWLCWLLPMMVVLRMGRPLTLVRA